MQKHVFRDKKLKERLDYVRLHGWGHLDLKNFGLDSIPSEIFKYEQLVFVDLSNDSYCDDENKNSITEIPDEIYKLKNLVTLNVANNTINKISETISSLKKLKNLNLANNQLHYISPQIANMPSLQNLHLEGNPFEMLPPEIISRGISSIRNFFKELEEKDYLYEVKLILVGEGRVGKTCLCQALTNDSYKLKETESTEGINISRWTIPQSEISKFNKNIQRDFQINIWDFGGQEIYHSTHQFFLTKRSIYLLVTESRKEDSHDNFFYWLNIIKLLGEDSPVAIVLNKCDQPTKELPIREYKEVFNNIVDLYKISLKSEYKEVFNKFKSSILEIASKLPHIGNPLPKVWVDIRIEIELLKLSGLNYISKSEYLEICKKHFRDEESALFLSDYFHDLGVIIHFKNDFYLRDIVVLNHEWITSGVYKVLDDKFIIEKKGRFDLNDITRIWSDKEFSDKIKELLSLMKNNKFDLCFELEDGKFLIPRLLPVDEIEHNWNSAPENLKFEFNYKFMPKGILARLIVKLNNIIFDNKYWRYGVILKYEETYAIIKEKYFENKITIELSGQSKREFLSIIRKAINEIHGDFNKLKVIEMVPCNCSHCKAIDSPSFYPYDLLRRYEQKGIVNIRCELSLDEVDVLGLTSDILRGITPHDKIIVCENQNSVLLKILDLPNLVFIPERDSNSVFINIKTYQDRFGLRDRDFLLDSEINKIKVKYKNYQILEYYCFENYLYHPSNLEELKSNGLIPDFIKSTYINDIITQKNRAKHQIFSTYKNSRNTYQEFKIESENLRIKSEENKIMEYLESDDIEMFFKSFSMKDHYDKSMIAKFGLQQKELASTIWFKDKFSKLIKSILN